MIYTNQNRRLKVSDDTKVRVALMIGMALMFGIDCVFMTSNHVWQTQAIEHNAARYNATTGKFEWIERGDK